MDNYFFDSIHKTNSPVHNFFEESLFFDGPSNFLGYRRVGWLKIDQVGRDHPSLYLLMTVSKLAVYIGFPYLLFCSLLGKTICRLVSNDGDMGAAQTHQGVHETPDKTPQISGELKVDLRGTVWFDYRHIAEEFHILQKSFPTKVFFSALAGFTSQSIRGLFEKKKFENLHVTLKTVNILAYESIVFPISVSGNHWTLLFIDRKKRTVEYCDSKISYGNYSQFVQDFKCVAEELSKADPGGKPYVFTSKIQKNLQPDGYQCGPWILYFTEKRLENPDIDFNELDERDAQSMIACHRLSVMEALNKKETFLFLNNPY